MDELHQTVFGHPPDEEGELKHELQYKQHFYRISFKDADEMSETMTTLWNDEFKDAAQCDDRISATISGEYDYYKKEEKSPRFLSVIFTNWLLAGRTMRKKINVTATEKDVDVQLRVTSGEWADRINGCGLYFSHDTYREFLMKPEVQELADELAGFVGPDSVEAYLASKEDIKTVRQKEPKSANQFSANSGKDPLGLETIERNKTASGGNKRKRNSDGKTKDH